MVDDPGDQDGRRRPGRGPDGARHGRGPVAPAQTTGAGGRRAQRRDGFRARRGPAGVAHRLSGLGRGRGVRLREAGSVLAHRCRRRGRSARQAPHCARRWTLRSAGDPSSGNRPRTRRMAIPPLEVEIHSVRDRVYIVRIPHVHMDSRGRTVQFLGQRPPPRYSPACEHSGLDARPSRRGRSAPLGRPHPHAPRPDPPGPRRRHPTPARGPGRDLAERGAQPRRRRRAARALGGPPGGLGGRPVRRRAGLRPPPRHARRRDGGRALPRAAGGPRRRRRARLRRRHRPGRPGRRHAGGAPVGPRGEPDRGGAAAAAVAPRAARVEHRRGGAAAGRHAPHGLHAAAQLRRSSASTCRRSTRRCPWKDERAPGRARRTRSSWRSSRCSRASSCAGRARLCWSFAAYVARHPASATASRPSGRRASTPRRSGC